MIDGNEIEIRNPRFTANGLIDVEIQHPDYGWIVFCCSPDDVMPYSAEIRMRALAMGPAAYVEPPPPVPQFVTPYQARVALLNANMIDQVNALMNSETVDPAARIAWEYASNFYRDSPFIATLGAELGLSSAQIDQLFIAAGAVI